MPNQLADADLVTSGKRSAHKTDCKSLIVATGIKPVRPEGRNYYLCDGGTKSHSVHTNGPDKWWVEEDGTWKFEGDSLKDPHFAGAQP
jgi:hypothetical protein